MTDHLENLKMHGYLVLDRVVPDDVFDDLIGELEKVIDTTAEELFASGWIDELFLNESFSRRLASLSKSKEARLSLWRSVQGKHHKSSGLFHVITDPSLLDIVSQFIGDEIFAHPQFNIRAVLPNQKENTAPWHQDLAYLDQSAAQTFTVSFWMPLQDTTADMGALEVIEGSHRQGLFRHEPSGNGYFAVPDPDLPGGRRVVCEVPRGGALVMLPTTVHRAMTNESPLVRWSLDLRYCKTGAQTGWDVPGFVCRSILNPSSVARSHTDWQKLMLKRGSVEGDHPGSDGLQDWTCVGELASGTPIILHMFLDSYSRFAIAEIRDANDSESCAGFFASQVRPFFDSLGVRVRRVITRPTEEYRETGGASCFHRLLGDQGIEHEFTDAIDPHRNILCAEFSNLLMNDLGFNLNGTLSDTTLLDLRERLDECLRYYNTVRIQKRRGRPPYVALMHALK